MIRSAQEFVELRQRNDPRATRDEAPEDVWHEVIKSFPGYREWVALNKTVPLSVLRILSCDEDAKVRFVVAMKRKCDEALFAQLACDREASVRERVACNAKTPRHILVSLCDDRSEQVRYAAALRVGLEEDDEVSDSER